ncbi:neutral zinc metallopeptidase [Bailinhaonella thermotolerans]|uniref:Metalloprotease n=1 Tax=Bailinhaonella thermotolerans TaxID=1070861 RepID=A0A3A4BLT7_9ACTN|nr:neutral zinc metallopeptidase [Bailinhaonella thermotolerans]RJL31982.1 hypothetical protein D5H75_16195 [Bailinhaonella thermotolerans]
MRRFLVALLLLVPLLASCTAGRDGASPPGQGAQETFETEVANVRAWTERFWEREFAATDRRYRPIRDFIAYPGKGGPPCGGEPAVPDNAFYCPVEHFIAYDENWLRGMYDQIGDSAVYVVIPHEIGHAVQAQLITDYRHTKELELQADCYAGAALAGIVRYGFVNPEPGDEQEIIKNFAAAGDPEETWWRPDLHGTFEQRQSAFAEGYQRGPAGCG